MKSIPRPNIPTLFNDWPNSQWSGVCQTKFGLKSGTALVGVNFSIERHSKSVH